ncbi:FliG C-terminal domain-containing protein [Wenxinia marina]|uniref:Flagellar motor switch protein FliG n=1 Tax=Wenxinia marina DSM 24838 TaxID=1123501 RepID=A0A0D0PBW4_9RHOB|nr:FliG C-terminal domain-containing protein [Wenxinia marina]KIQ68966.1 Flagellar motor switch protein [Wenxinia marina DSM 24838]GGL63682.1 flagellar motor switch protein FliG [Wenxinia marina]
MSLAALSAAEAGAPRGAPPLSRRRKAALIVQLALADGRALPLAELPEDAQVDLTRELGRIRLVDRETLASVAEEFLDSLDNLGLSASGGLDRAIEALSSHISPEAAARARAEVARARGLDPWPRVVALPPAELQALMENESTEVAAVCLSKLDVGKAAELLARLPGPLARRITYAVSLTSGIQPPAVRRIGEALAAQYAVKPEKAFEAPPVDRVGAILNSSKTATREAVLDALEEEDPAFAEDVRRAIFTFKDIPARLAAIDVPVVLRAVDNDRLVTALAAAMATGGAEASAAEYLLDNISQRLADNLRDEMKGKTGLKRSVAEAAWGEVVTAIRTRAESGEITLVEPSSGEDEEETLG